MKNNMIVPVAPAKASFGTFESEEQCLRWVATNHGTDVRDACIKRVAEELSKGNSVDILRIVDEIDFLTDSVDVAKKPLHAKFR